MTISVTGHTGVEEDLAALLLNSTGEGIYGVDMDGLCTFANPACVRLLGFDSDKDLLGVHMHDLVHHTRPNGDPYPVEECRIYQAFRQCGGVHVDDEVMFRRDGSSFPTEYWSYPVQRDGELVGSVLTFVDISERRATEARLAEANEQVRLLLDSTGEGIYGVDMDGLCTFANPACVRLLGFDSDEDLLGVQMHDLVHHTRPNGDPYPVEECQIYQAFRQCGGVHVDDEVMFRRDGSSFPAEYWSYPVQRDGELAGCVLTFVDISDRLELEQTLRQTEKMAALGKLSAGLAHELNNPAAAATRASGQLVGALDDLQGATVELTRAGIPPDLTAALSAWAGEMRQRELPTEELSALDAADREDELLEWLDQHGVEDGSAMAGVLSTAGVAADDLDALALSLPAEPLAMTWLCRALSADQLASTVIQSTRSISALVDVVKSYSSMDQAPVQVIDVRRGIDDTIALLEYRLGGDVEIVREYGEGLPAVEAPVVELNQVWMNVLDNAIDAVEAVDGAGKQTITIRTHVDGSDVVVEMADDGCGIPADAQDCVFDPFFTTKTVGEGVGLGLDVVRRIVDRCGGTVKLSSSPGGTTVAVRVPAAS